jgi:hypothetical protein
MFSKCTHIPSFSKSKRTANLEKRRSYFGDHRGFIDTMSFNNHQIALARKQGSDAVKGEMAAQLLPQVRAWVESTKPQSWREVLVLMAVIADTVVLRAPLDYSEKHYTITRLTQDLLLTTVRRMLPRTEEVKAAIRSSVNYFEWDMLSFSPIEPKPFSIAKDIFEAVTHRELADAVETIAFRPEKVAETLAQLFMYNREEEGRNHDFFELKGELVVPCVEAIEHKYHLQCVSSGLAPPKPMNTQGLDLLHELLGIQEAPPLKKAKTEADVVSL